MVSFLLFVLTTHILYFTNHHIRESETYQFYEKVIHMIIGILLLYFSFMVNFKNRKNSSNVGIKFYLSWHHSNNCIKS